MTRERDSLQHIVTDVRKKSAHLQEANLRLQTDVQVSLGQFRRHVCSNVCLYFILLLLQSLMPTGI